MTDLHKIVVMGYGGVGKSSLTVRFVQDIFLEKYDPTIEDSYRKTLNLKGKSVFCEILDTAGTEQFQTMLQSYIKHGKCFVLVYDITSQVSFNHLQNLIEKIQQIKEENISVIIVGNKSDMEDKRVISHETGKQFADDKKFLFIEASAKASRNVNELFETVLEDYFSKTQVDKKKKSSKCCIF